MKLARISLVVCLILVCRQAILFGQGGDLPFHQDRPSGPPLSPEQAIAKMTVPAGFTVELVASEPDLINPVAMCIDEKGRFWITESIEYPRREPGPGRDRVKILEDTDGDGKADKFTVFAEGLNIPSGIAVGYGGVWVANAPDLLFMQDIDGDGTADKVETVVTGFGRTDTHELPNSLTWGPDGWLYGNNGCFNVCHVKYPESNPNFKPDHPGWGFAGAVWRIHPRTREFQIFAQGLSNPWGIAFNDDGELFVSACVIDHLWHIVEGGQYIRQVPNYPAHAWPIPSIVRHKHQKAAYCGLTWFDSDAYPEEYRRVLYMGNIHGGCINADVIEPSGSTYKATPHPGFEAKPGAWSNDEFGTIRKQGDDANPRLADLLNANDAWFMPVVQTTGPDGCLYILDWYDRYHCYQDANADPAGIDRGKGRLYRLRYQETPHAPPVDLAKLSDDQLLPLMVKGPNGYVRETARRLLAERLCDETTQSADTIRELEKVLNDRRLPVPQRLRALWTLASSDRLSLDRCFECTSSQFPVLRRWGLRFLLELCRDGDDDRVREALGLPWEQAWPPQVTLQAAISFPKMIRRIAPEHHSAARQMMVICAHASEGDSLVKQVVWQNLIELIADDPFNFISNIQDVSEQLDNGESDELIRRGLILVCDDHELPGDAVWSFIRWIWEDGDNPQLREQAIQILAEKTRSGALKGKRLEDLQERMESWPIPLEEEARTNPSAVMLLALWGSQSARERVHALLESTRSQHAVRIAALQTLIALNDDSLVETIERVLKSSESTRQFRGAVIDAIDQYNHPEVAAVLLRSFNAFEPDLQPRAIEVLTQRPHWSLSLLEEIRAERVNKALLNYNQLQRLALFPDSRVQQLLKDLYGQVRSEHRRDRQHAVIVKREMFRTATGDPFQGALVFKKTCAQCHKIYGEGADVGPDITVNGRNSWDQLLQNVFDPSAVIGPSYQAHIIATTDGRVLTGLLVEETEEQLVLKIQGGKLEAIPRDQVEEMKSSELSMMPEDQDRQLTSQELIDLFAFLALDRPPDDPQAKALPGAPHMRKRPAGNN